MKKIPIGTKFDSFSALAVAMGMKPRKVDMARRKAQQEKLCKCSKCGGQMEYVSGTNIMTCSCEIEKDGAKIPCRNTRILNPNTAKYATEIFA